MAKKPIICKLCGWEMEEEKEDYDEGYYSCCATVRCDKCGIMIFTDTLRKARSKARNLMK